MRSNAISVVACALAFVALCGVINHVYVQRCDALGGTWSMIRGCKVVNMHGKVQWVSRP